MGRRRPGLFDALDGVEAIYHGVLGVVLMGVSVYIGVRLAHDLGGPLLAAVPAVLFIAVIVLALRDAMRGRWGPASIGVAVAYAACVAIVIVVEIVRS
ncbi:MAG: hypothetical protein JJU45_19515 [Acidimicrobiia bacterium]|nr:hypothetical protein [Acidimicrobiia bacterium]